MVFKKLHRNISYGVSSVYSETRINLSPIGLHKSRLPNTNSLGSENFQTIFHFQKIQKEKFKDSEIIKSKMAAKQMEEIQKKLAMLNYPRANAPAQSLLFAGMERYSLLEWLFFK